MDTTEAIFWSIKVAKKATKSSLNFTFTIRESKAGQQHASFPEQPICTWMGQQCHTTASKPQTQVSRSTVLLEETNTNITKPQFIDLGIPIGHPFT